MRFRNFMSAIAIVAVAGPLSATVTVVAKGTPASLYPSKTWTLTASEYITGVKTGSVYVQYYKSGSTYAAYIPMFGVSVFGSSQAELKAYIVANFDSLMAM